MNRTLFAVHLLGGFQLRRDGTIVDVPQSSQRLLGFLALQDRGLAADTSPGRCGRTPPRTRRRRTCARPCGGSAGRSSS